jgi:hypothetical protein
MSLKKYSSYWSLLAALFVCAGTAAAQGPSVSATTTSNLEMTATVQTAVQLNMSTGTGGATLSGSNATGLFSINFGNINALGAGAPASGVTVAADANGALYKTPINLTPVYTGFAVAGTAHVSVDKGSSGDEALAREGDSSISAASTVIATHSCFATAASGSNNERWVGFYVPRNTLAGAKTATLIYTVIIE